MRVRNEAKQQVNILPLSLSRCTLCCLYIAHVSDRDLSTPVAAAVGVAGVDLKGQRPPLTEPVLGKINKYERFPNIQMRQGSDICMDRQ